MRIDPPFRNTLVAVVAAAACLVAALSLGSCADSEAAVIRLATSRPEFAGYAELFNQEQPEYKVELVYAAEPQELLSQPGPPDIVVSERLTSRDAFARLDALDILFRGGALRRDSFYPGSLQLGTYEGRQRAIAISFNLPAVVFRSSHAQELGAGFVEDVADLKATAAGFNAVSGDRITRMGFSPLWDRSFLVTTAVFGPPSFDGGADGRMTWRSAELLSAVRLLRDWVGRVNGSMAAQQEFTDRYLYGPYTELLRQGRIEFYQVSSRELFGLSPSRLDGLDYRWLSIGERIPVLADVVSVGIPRGARHKGAARAFLRWFLSAESQEAILADSTSGQTRGEGFGIAGGFSTLPEVNERSLARFYPILLGHILTPDLLRFPQALPTDWKEIRDTLVLPWLVDVVKRTREPDEGLAQELTLFLRDGVEELRRDRD